jgi:hypothetical protein
LYQTPIWSLHGKACTENPSFSNLNTAGVCGQYYSVLLMEGVSTMSIILAFFFTFLVAGNLKLNDTRSILGIFFILLMFFGSIGNPSDSSTGNSARTSYTDYTNNRVLKNLERNHREVVSQLQNENLSTDERRALEYKKDCLWHEIVNF